jgi:hypothetical protein
MLGYFHLSSLGWRGAGENCRGGRHTLQPHLRCYYTGLNHQSCQFHPKQRPYCSYPDPVDPQLIGPRDPDP